MTRIKLTLTGAHAAAEVSGPLTSGMAGLPVTIEYDDAWQGLTKNLVCRCGRPYYPPDPACTWIIPNIGAAATVAHEAMQADRYLYLGVEGYSSDGSLVMPTNWVECGLILPGAQTVSSRSVPPTLPVWARLEADITQLKEDTVSRAQLADISQTVDRAVLFTTQELTAAQQAQVRTNIGVQGDIPDYVKAEAERVAAVVHARQHANTISFIACADLHYSDPGNAAPHPNAAYFQAAITHMGQAMKLIRDRVHIDFAATLGDMFWDRGETPAEALAGIRFMNSCLADSFSGIPNFRAVGNHDHGSGIGANFPEGALFSNIGIFNTGAVFGRRSAGYCYRDFEDQKLRVICLNSSESGDCLFSADQVSWLASALDLSAKGSGWRSILLSHHPLDWGLSGGVNPISTVNSAEGLICSVHGHLHNGKTGTITGTSIPRICVPNAGHGRENECGTEYGVDWKDDVTYSKTPGTAADTCFYVFTIDLAAGMIYADHYGAGRSHAVPYHCCVYTNLVPTATADVNTTEIYNGVGYADNTFISTVNTDGSAEGYVATGVLPLKKTDVIYIKGAQLTGDDKVRLYVFTTTGTAKCFCKAPSVSGGYFADTAGTQRFTIEQLGDLYYKVTPIQSVLDNSMYYRISLVGSGANLVITHNEPIE